MTETLVIKSDFKRFDEWIDAFAGKDIQVLDWDSVTDRHSIDYALVWKPGVGTLEQFPNLKVIFSVGAGLDHLKGDRILPPGIPVVRMVEETLTTGMVEYVLYTVLRYHRFFPQYERDKQERKWEPILQVPPYRRNIGILGLGELGSRCARVLADLGFKVSGWSRTQKSLDGITCLCGDDGFEQLMSQTDILVCLLPLTDATRHILNADNLSKLPEGSCIINAGRGGHQVETDILAALDSGQLAGAALDVFETEPLPADSPLWSHPGVTFTPHVASMTLPRSSAVHVYDNIERFRNGQPLTHVADMDRGY